MPIDVANEIDAKCQKFLWNGTLNKMKLSMVKWDIVCKEKMKDGMGLRKMKVLNQALRGKLVWKMDIKEERDWIKFCTTKYLKNNQIIKLTNPPYGSPFWNILVDGNGESIYFWEDAWIREKPLISYKQFKQEELNYIICQGECF